MRRSSFLIGIVVAAGCGTEPSGILTVTVDALPMFTPETSIQVSGTVSREPVSESPIVVSVAGGAETVSDTVAGSFNFSVGLPSNRETQLAVIASDGTGSVSDPVIVVIFHDDTGPQVASSVPSNRANGVSLDTPIQIRFAEPLVQTGAEASFRLTQNSRTVPGIATISGDSTLFTFQPDQALEPHSIYELVVQGFADEAGNPAGDGRNVCFITTTEGLTPEVTTDTSSIFFRGEQEPRDVAPPNLVGASLARSGETLYGLFEFNQERSLNGAANKVSIFMDIDLDQNRDTGFQGFKDFQLDENFPEFNSGLGAELVVSLDAHVVDDSSFVGVSIDDVEWEEIDVFLPGVCGKFFGFHTTTIFGDSIMDNGRFDYVYTAFLVEDPDEDISFVALDPVPLDGRFTADLTDPGATAMQRLRAPRRQFHPRRVEAPFWRLLRFLRSR